MLTHIFKTVVTLASCLLCLGMMGCVTTPPAVSLDQRLVAIQPTESQGVGFLKVHAPRTIFPQLHSSWQNIYVVNVDTNQIYVLPNQEGAHERYSLFVGTLPAGTYRPTTLSSNVVNGQVSLSLKNAASFKVVAGHISDLGTLLAIPSGYISRFGSLRQPQSSQDTLVFHARSTAESVQLMSIIRQKAPGLAVLDYGVAWGIHSNPLNDFPPVNAQGISAQFHSPVTLPSGEMFAGEEVGQIRHRTNNGIWSWLNTGLTSAIRAVAVLDDGTLLAGSSHGLLFSKTKNSNAWISYTLPISDSVILAVGHTKSGIMVCVASGQDVVLLSTPTLSATAHWTERKRIQLGNLFQTTLVPRITPDGFSLLETTAGPTISGRIHYFDVVSGSFETRPMKTNWGGLLGALSLASDGTIFQVLGGTAISQDMRISSDHGKTWVNHPTPNWIVSINMISRTTGYALRMDSVGVTTSGQFSVWTTTDGAITWKRLGNAPAYFTQFFELNTQELAGTTDKGKLYISKDRGRSWKEEIFLR